MTNFVHAKPGDVMAYLVSDGPADFWADGDTYRLGLVLRARADGLITDWEDHLGEYQIGRPTNAWLASKSRIEEKLGHRIKGDDLADLVMLSSAYPSRQAAIDYILNFWRAPPC